MAGGNAPFEPRLTPDEVYHGFIHPWDEETKPMNSIKAFRPCDTGGLALQDEGFGVPLDLGGDW